MTDQAMNVNNALPAPGAQPWRLGGYTWLFTSRWRVFAVGVVVLGLVGLLDWQTGPHVTLTSLYLLPACLLAWFFGRKVGYLVALVNAAIWFALDLTINANLSAPLLYWNAGMRMLTLIVMVHIIAICRGFADEIERLVEVRTAELARQLRERQASEHAIRALTTQVCAAEDVERRRLGQDLHDTVGQGLSVLKLQLDAYVAEHPEMCTAAASWNSVLENVLHQTRTLTFELYPSMLDELGLCPTLRWYVSKLEEQTAASIVISETGAPQKLDAPMAGFLFRAVKELITNALKHGRAGEVCVQVRWRENELRVIVDDDGAGFEPGTAAGANRGLGLSWVRERSNSFGGTLVIESGAGAGTRVLLDVPTTRNEERSGS